MASISLDDWGNYPGVYNMVAALGAYMENLRSNFGVLSSVAQDVAGQPSAAMIDNLRASISLIEQISAEVENVIDPYIDVDRWKMYLSDLDTTVRCWMRLPAFYNTGADFASMGYPTTRPYSVSKDDTWSSIEDNTGVPWTKTAQVNKQVSAAEEASSWTGTELAIPIPASDVVALVPGITGSQLAEKVLGLDFSNSLTIETVAGPVALQARLGQDITNATTGAVRVTNTASFPYSSGYLQIGSEIIYYSAVNTSAGTVTLTTRGYRGTTAVAHSQNDLAEVFSYITQARVLPYTDTFVQGLNNALVLSPVESLLGGDYGTAKGGILLVAVINALKSDPRVDYITNVEAQVSKDRFIVSLSVGSVGNLTIQTLRLNYTGSF